MIRQKKYGKKIQWESRLEGKSHIPITSPVILGNLLFIIWAHIAHIFVSLYVMCTIILSSLLYVFKCKRGKIHITDQPVILDNKNKI